MLNYEVSDIVLVGGVSARYLVITSHESDMNTCKDLIH